jgi:hypothetical protein
MRNVGDKSRERTKTHFLFNLFFLPKRRWEDNIKMGLQEVECGGVDWIELAQDRDR